MIEDIIVGETVDEVERGESQIFLKFSFGGHLVIYNKYEIKKGNIEDIQQKITSVNFKEGNLLEIEFESGTLLRVGLRENDYTGPEAFLLYVPGMDTIVCN